MSSYLNEVIKCPICGENRNIEKLGKVNIDGLDPFMEGYICKHEVLKFGKGKKWLTVVSKKICDTKFYIAPKPTIKSEKLKQLVNKCS